MHAHARMAGLQHSRRRWNAPGRVGLSGCGQRRFSAAYPTQRKSPVRALMESSSGYRKRNSAGCAHAAASARPRSAAPSPPRAWCQHTTASNAPARAAARAALAPRPGPCPASARRTTCGNQGPRACRRAKLPRSPGTASRRRAAGQRGDSQADMPPLLQVPWKPIFGSRAIRISSVP